MQLALRLLPRGAAADGGVAPFEHGVAGLARIAAAARKVLEGARPRPRLSMLEWVRPVLAGSLAAMATEACTTDPPICICVEGVIFMCLQTCQIRRIAPLVVPAWSIEATSWDSDLNIC